MKTKYFKLMLIAFLLLLYTSIEAQIDTQEAIDSIATKELKIEIPEDENEREADNTADKVIREVTPDDNSNNEEPELPPQPGQDLDYEDSELAPQPEEYLDYEDSDLPSQPGEDLDYEDSELAPQPEEDLDYEDSVLPPQPGEDLEYENSELPPQPGKDLDYEDSELPSKPEDLDNKEKINISYPLEDWEGKKGGFSGCLAMIVSWRDGIEVSPMDIAAAVGKYEQIKTGFSTADKEIYNHWKLKTITEAQSYPVDFFAKILENGPLLVAMSFGDKTHAGTVTGMHGDGTPESTLVTIYRNCEKKVFKKYTMSYKEFDKNRMKVIQDHLKYKKENPDYNKKPVFIAY